MQSVKRKILTHLPSRERVSDLLADRIHWTPPFAQAPQSYNCLEEMEESWAPVNPKCLSLDQLHQKPMNDVKITDTYPCLRPTNLPTQELQYLGHRGHTCELYRWLWDRYDRAHSLGNTNSVSTVRRGGSNQEPSHTCLHLCQASASHRPDPGPANDSSPSVPTCWVHVLHHPYFHTWGKISAGDSTVMCAGHSLAGDLLIPLNKEVDLECTKKPRQ